MFIPLYNKSNYSLLSSLLKIDDIIAYAKQNNISAISLTDTTMYGTMEFIKKCQKENVKPIIGLDILMDYNFLLLATNYQGYKNLIKLSTIQNERGINLDDINKYNKNLICLLPFKNKEHFQNLGEIYEDIYLGFSTKEEELAAHIITEKIIFLQENLYLNEEDAKILPYLYMIRDGKTITDNPIYDVNNHELNIINVNFLSSQKGLDATLEVARNCNLEFPETKNLLPIYECADAKTYLFELCKKGLYKRLNGNIPDTYKNRLIYELKTINDMGFSNYFLVVYDFIKYAKKENILVGPGRGSAAGSLVAYSLGITDIDPLKYGLLFERFLNPERQTMPDIDTDFPDNKRDQVINYVIEKYGKKRVCGIVTFGTLSAKQVIRDTSRALNIPLSKVDSLCKNIPIITKEKLKDFYQNNSYFKAQIDSDITLSKMFKIAQALEGFPRHTSSHAAGIVMSQVDLDEVIPLTAADGMYLSSYSMEYLEDLGLLKMDFLGLKNLTIIDNIISDINAMGIDINFSKIPLDDRGALQIFTEADTTGIFQFESSGMKNFLRKLKPNSFDDIVAAIALFRPGAAPNIDPYIRRKNNLEKVTYIDKSLETISKSTYGLLIYQEQIMQAANLYAGYSLGEADILRRAMSKKKIELIKNEEEKFITKSIAKGHTANQAKEVFSLVLNFAGYGFNKSHSVAYSVIALKMAYLKSHYKTVFFANLLTNVIGSEAKTNEYIMEAKANNIEIVKPTILEDATTKYIVKDNKIIFPLSNIKSIGSVVSNTIKKVKEEGNFSDIYDCFSRLYIAGIGKKNFEVLINADTFRDFSYNRATLIYNLDSLFNYAELTKDIDPSLVIKPDIEFQKEYSNSYLLNMEKEVFGFYLSNHPASFYKAKENNCISLNMISNYFNKKIDVIILIDKIKVISTKKGEKMAFITGSDETSSADFTLFPRIYKDFVNIQRGDIIKVRGVVEKRLNTYQIIVDQFKKMEENLNEKTI